NAVLVSKRQEGNPVLKHIRNVRWQFTDIVPDYQMGPNTCALFLSLRYHLLKPTYIYGRIKELQRAFRTRVLLCHVDVDDVVEPLAQVTKAALLNDCTLICAWSHEECARYLETYKAYESKPADAIQGRTEEDYLSKLTAALTTVRGVNKTDVLTLGGAFKTAAGVMRANMQQLSALPGIGPTKACPCKMHLSCSRTELVAIHMQSLDTLTRRHSEVCSV
ncbi:DNA repair protein rad10, partial [Coccomyxa subellipsoidea C-169]